MAVGALGELASAEAQTTSKFADAANTSVHWGAGYIAQGVADGFIDGYDDNRFGPDDTVTYAQACKMLVASIGYTTYAEAAGGWPAGYTSQASSLGISKGVSAQNDTAITRGQVAILIANAMDVPLCVTDSWETTATITGTIQTPVLKKLDGKENRDYQTLLTDRHDAYKVKGRVTANAKGSADGLKKDEVKYNVEVADNFDDDINIKKGNGNIRKNEIFKVGDTNAADTLFAYTEAVVQKDEDSDEFTILAIENYGNAKTVDFKADDVADDDSTIGTDYIGNGKIPVYKSETTSSTTKYDLDADAIMYVNGVEAGDATNQMIDDYILNNPTGMVTLVDETEVGSTSTDGKYDYILVDYYVDAVVDYTSSTASKARVYFKQSQIGATKMEWDPDDQDVDITFTKDGQKIAYTDLAEFDVLSVQYDIIGEGMGSNSLTDKEYYNVLVSTNKVTGNVTSKDTEDETITIAGNEYDLVDGMTSTSDYELGTEYDVYVDTFGYVAYFEEGSSDKNYGVIVAMYTSSGDDNATVRMITSDAKVVAYECKDETEENKFYQYATGESGSYKSFKKTDYKDRIVNGQTVCTYKLTNGKIKFDKAYTGVGSTDGKMLEYKENTTKLGSYSISDATTKIVDMDAYMNGNDTTVKTLSVASFEDEAEYQAVLFDKNSDSVYRFAIVLEGTSSIRPETQIAVIKSSDGQRDMDSTTCSAYTVLKGGQEVEMLYEDEDASYAEGSVVAYVVGNDGYVEIGDLYVLYTPESTYDATYSNILANDDFGKQLKYVSQITTGRDAGKYEISYKDGKKSETKDVYAYLGVVYEKGAKSMSLFTSKANGESQVADAVDIDPSSANVYTFDYNERVNKGVRLAVGNSATQKGQTVFKQGLVNEKNTVVWDDLDGATPQLAFVKEVDGDATDIVYYVAP
jgi:hypothetical protein